jgi:hypothetical protein
LRNRKRQIISARLSAFLYNYSPNIRFVQPEKLEELW